MMIYDDESSYEDVSDMTSDPINIDSKSWEEYNVECCSNVIPLAEDCDWWQQIFKCSIQKWGMNKVRENQLETVHHLVDH